MQSEVKSFSCQPPFRRVPNELYHDVWGLCAEILHQITSAGLNGAIHVHL